MSNEKTINANANENPANLIHAEGFNPELYARVISDDGVNTRKYLDVVWRKVWFYLKYPNGRITKKIMQMTNQFVIIEARVYFDRNDAEENYVSSAMAQRWFNKGDVFGERAVETAETGAVGRALADAGFGLQYCCDVNGDAEQDIVDAPVISSPAKPQVNTEANKTRAENNIPAAQAKITAPVGLLVDSDNKTSVNSEPVKDEINEDISEDLEKIKTGEAENSQTEEISGAPEDNLNGTGQTEESARQDYNNSMEVSEIEKIMTVEEAVDFVVDVGFNKGKTLGEIAHTSPDKLGWYFKSYTGPNNILRAGAKILSDYMVELQQKKAG